MGAARPFGLAAMARLSHGPLVFSSSCASSGPVLLSSSGKEKAFACCFLPPSHSKAVEYWKFCPLAGWRNPHRKVLIQKHCKLTGVHTFASSSPAYSGQIDMPAGDNKKPSGYFSWPHKKRPRICILGGGFGGLYTALRLETLSWPPEKQPQVLLVDQSDRFLFKPMLYELLSKEVDTWEIAPLFADLVSNTSIQFRKDEVVAVAPWDSINEHGKVLESKGGGMVSLASGIQVEYDWLVLALGAQSKLDMVPGALDYALPFSLLEDALEVDRRLKILERERFEPGKPPIRVVIIGAGYSGIELAATLSERLGIKGFVQVVHPTSEICPAASAGSREVSLRVLSSMKVELLLCYVVSSIQVSTNVQNPNITENSSTLVLELTPVNKNTRQSDMCMKNIEADIVLWTGGIKAVVPSGEPDSFKKPFSINERGQVETDETLRVKGHPRIFALGDSADARDSSGRLLAATAQVAFQQADYAGWNLWAAINNRPLLPFRYQHLGELMVLGNNNGVFSPGFVEGFTLDGSLGHTVRKLAYLYRLPTNEHRVKVGLSWLGKSIIKSVSEVQDTLAKLVSPSNTSA